MLTLGIPRSKIAVRCGGGGGGGGGRGGSEQISVLFVKYIPGNWI